MISYMKFWNIQNNLFINNIFDKVLYNRLYGIETMLDNFNGMYELLEYSSREGVKNTLYISSSEVYEKRNQ